MGTNHHYGYQIRKIYTTAWLMRNAIHRSSKADEIIRTLVFWSALQESRRPCAEIRDELLDSWNTLLQAKLISAMLLPDDRDRIQALQGLSRWVSGSVNYTPGTIGGIKPDGTTFHHGGFYPGYTTGALATVADYVAMTSGTSFVPTLEARRVLAQAFTSMRNYSNMYEWGTGIGGRHPFTGKMGAADIKAFAQLALSGDLSGEGNEFDHHLAADYLRLIDGKNTPEARFFKEKRGRKTAPYTNELTQEEVDAIMDRSMRLTDRYRQMKAAGCSEEEIRKAFNTKHEMSVFSYEGEKDTIMTPMDSIRYYKYFLRAGFMSMDPVTGYVKAYVGGPNYNYFQYDMAMVGRRQVGSTIKPYLYALAMENGFSPCDEVRNVEQTLFDENGKAWSPRNSSKSHYGEIVTLKWGLANSNNWISAYLMSKLSPYALARLIHSFGVLNKDIQPTVSLCLGPCEISVGEMVSAYTAFANRGIRTAPLFVSRIEDNEGNVIATFSPQVDEVISESSAYKMLVMLRAVINEGTGGRVRRLYGIKADMGGKTGTTNRNSDGWFMGFTPSLVSGCWVGGEERDIHFDTMRDGQGASMALPVWGLYMQKVYADKTLGYSEEEHFDIPEDFDPCKDKLTEMEEENASRLDDVFFQ